jgi:catechol 2,3-dioxygenase-like lactoylglutathione lyase family enzyme
MEQLSLKSSTKVLTYGLTHLALKVADIERSIQFYQHVFNVKLMYHTPKFAQVCTPGSNDIIVFEKSKSKRIGSSGGIAHFGFRLRQPEDITMMSLRVIEAGGRIKEQGEFLPGEPYLFFFDPDGYEIEVWYELVTRVDL